MKAPFFVRGRLVEGDEVRHTSRDLGADFATPTLDLDAVIAPRSELPPLLDVKLSEIIDFLVATGDALDLDTNPHMQACLDLLAATNPLPRRVVENLYRSAPMLLRRESLESMIDANFADPAVLDGWVTRTDAQCNRGHLRAFPPRMVHMLAGNAPAGCIASIAQGALVKGINLFKIEDNVDFGVRILKDYVRRFGLQEGVKRYKGWNADDPDSSRSAEDYLAKVQRIYSSPKSTLQN